MARLTLTWPDVWARRLARHALLVPAEPSELVEVVRRVSGIHAQMMGAAELSLGIRIAGITRREVQAELWERRRLVKTYGLRGTVHLFPADELPLWTAALRANPRPREDRRLTQLGLDPAQRDAVLAAIGEVLDGQCLTRDELGEEVVRRAGAWAGDAVSPAFGDNWPRWQMALVAAAFDGILCFGPNRGTKVTFVRPEQWLGQWQPVDGREALRTICKRYLDTYGPATYHNFARWFGMPPGGASALFREIRDELVEVEVEGERAWLPREGAADMFTPVRGVVHLLPHFDCYVIGCHPRSRLVPEHVAARVITGGSAGNRPVVLIDGVVAGLWHQRRIGRQVKVTIELFEAPNRGRHQAIEAAAARIAEVLQGEPDVDFGPVKVGPHL